MATTRIALVDLPHRLARTRSVLAEVPGVSVAVPTPLRTSAAVDPAAYAEVDAVVVGVFDDDAPFDRVVGAAAIRTIGATLTPRPTLVALSDRTVSDVVRLRLAAAGADLLVHEDLLADLPKVLATGPTTAWHPTPRSLELGEHGIGASADLNGLIDHVVAHDLISAFDGSDRRAGGGLTRRRAITVRTHLAELVDARPVTWSSGAVVERTLPSWAQLARLVDAARGIDDAPLGATSLGGGSDA